MTLIMCAIEGSARVLNTLNKRMPHLKLEKVEILRTFLTHFWAINAILDCKKCNLGLKRSLILKRLRDAIQLKLERMTFSQGLSTGHFNYSSLEVFLLHCDFVVELFTRLVQAISNTSNLNKAVETYWID